MDPACAEDRNGKKNGDLGNIVVVLVEDGLEQAGDEDGVEIAGDEIGAAEPWFVGVGEGVDVVLWGSDEDVKNVEPTHPGDSVEGGRK